MTRTGDGIGRRDIAFTAVLTMLGLLLMYENVTDATVDASPLAIPAFLAVTVPLLWRREAPLAAAAATLAGLALHVAVFGSVTRCGVVFPVAWLLVFTAGARLDRRQACVGLLLGLAVITVMTLADGTVGPADLVGFAPVTAAVWGVGRLMHSRGRMVQQLRVQTEELRGARDERARLEVRTDRARLAGELDELLQRRLGDLGRLAVAGASVSDPGVAGATLRDIERGSRQTLDEMRTVVGVLHGEEDRAPVAPQPTLTHLEAMLMRAKGADAHLTVSGSPRLLPAGVELSAYRVVEHLLDALEDAPGVDVGVRFTDDALELSVTGPARRRSDAGAAIERARERVQLHRGTLRTSTRGGRAEAVARLPVLAGA